jgi:tetratricopeptide (TPR) repeat protein
LSEQPLNVPHVIADRYAIEREVGRGGMAVVYFAKDLRHYRDVAIKIFRRDGNEPDEGSERFLQEIKIAARLSHPNILPLHDSGDDHGLLFYVMPYVPGESLRQRLEREGALPLTDALTIATEIANALAYAHSHGVIHRDIKPENILFIAGNAVVADFGIARAISAGGWEEWRLAGPVGTPAYMSPEQGRGGSRVDGRSDLYSLGCVLYEMLTGEPPFRGNTPEELMSLHSEVEPQPVHSIRPTLPADVQLAVGRALAKHPADRYQTALQMAEALTRLRANTSGEHQPRVTPVNATAPSRDGRGLSHWFRRWGGPSVIAAGLAAALFWSTGWVKASRLDTGLMLVGPFVHREGIPAELDGEQCSRLVMQALSRWEDLRATDSRWANDRVAQLGHNASLDDLADIAREGGAGRLVSGEVWTGTGDSVRIRGVLYDVRHGISVVRQFTVSVPRGLEGLADRFNELADSLVLPRASSAAAATGHEASRSLAALMTYDSAHAALAKWDLLTARDYFTHAIAIDPAFQLAYLWRAQVRSWQGTSPKSWGEDVRLGLQNPLRLSARDREWGRAMLALAEARFPDACAQFNEMLKRDTLDFRAWYGRGDCRAKDKVVIRDARQKSGFTFRGSYAGAIADYMRALTLIPMSHQLYRGGAFEGLMRTLYAQDYYVRAGYTEGEDSLPFMALPSLEADTLAFVAWSPEDMAENPDALSESRWEAVRRNQEQVRRLTTNWVNEFPTSVTARRARALILEILGQIDSTRTQPSALSEIVRARALATDSVQAAELATTQVRLLFKASQFHAARVLAESLFATIQSDPTLEQEMVGMAALFGRPSLAGNLARLELTRFNAWKGPTLSPPPAIREVGVRLLAFSSVGGPRDSVEYYHKLAHQRIRSGVPSDQRSTVRSAVIDHATVLLDEAWKDPLFQPERDDHFSLMINMLAARRGDTAAMRAHLAPVKKLRESARAWLYQAEGQLKFGRMYLLLHDTASAIGPLDVALPSLEGITPRFFTQISQTGAFVRLLLFRMEVALAQGDLPTARRWASVAVELWGNAEPGVQPQLATARAVLK